MREALGEGGKVAQLTFPYHNHPPTCFFQFPPRSEVSRNIALELAVPELGAGLRDVCESTVVAMPEAAVDEHDGPPTPQNDVRLSRQVSGMEPIAVSHCVQEATDGQFRASIAAPDAAHEYAAFFPAHDVEPRTRLASVRNP